jgi:hypothetical protein
MIQRIDIDASFLRVHNGGRRRAGAGYREPRKQGKNRGEAAGVGFEPTGDLSAASGFQDDRSCTGEAGLRPPCVSLASVPARSVSSREAASLSFEDVIAETSKHLDETRLERQGKGEETIEKHKRELLPAGTDPPGGMSLEDY